MESKLVASKLDYLQRYLRQGDAIKAENDQVLIKKKKKKDKDKKKATTGGFKIIDDGGLFGKAQDEKEKKPKGQKVKKSDRGERPRMLVKEDGDEDDDELAYAVLEDRPQIAGFVDERPEIEIMKERRFTTSTFTTIVKSEDEDEDEDATKKPVHNILPDFKIKEEPIDEEESPKRRRKRHDSSDDDASTTRRRHDSSDGDNSNKRQRRKRHDSSEDGDKSPPRQKRRHDSSGGDNSPTRSRKRRVSDNSPPRNRKGKQASPDMSPPRRRTAARHSDSDNSPPRRRAEPPVVLKNEADVKREVDSDGDISPPRRRNMMEKTLDGKRAGLQKAGDLKEEMLALKRRENDKFEKVLLGSIFQKSGNDKLFYSQ
jgi:pre-mRNA-splicing factor CWC26